MRYVFNEFFKKIPNFCDGRFTVLGALSGMGKTTFTLMLALYLVTYRNVFVSFVSFEMSEEDIIREADRMLKTLYSSSYDEVKSKLKIYSTCFVKQLNSHKISILGYIPVISSDDFENSFIFIDNIDLYNEFYNNNPDILFNYLKNYSSFNNVNVFVTTNLNDPEEKRNPYKPSYKDLNNENIFNSCDILLLLNIDEITRCIIVKNRNGEKFVLEYRHLEKYEIYRDVSILLHG